MKTRAATRVLFAGMTCALHFAVLSACGADQGPHYAAGSKSYGAPRDGAADARAADAPIVILPADLPPSAAVPAEEIAVIAAGATPPPLPALDDVGTVTHDEAVEETPKLAPEAPIKKLLLRSYFDTSSAIGMKAGRGYRALGPLVLGKVVDSLTSAPEDGMILTQTFGDGVARSLATQDVTNSAGDANRVEGQPTASALQTLFRLNSADCPGVFLCIEKMTVAPKEGASQTICFTDPATAKPKPFPYGAPPNYKEVDYDAHYGDYGPWTVALYEGGSVDCSEPDTAPVLVETIATTISKVDVATIPYALHTIDPTPATFAIRFERHRVTDDLVAPYADETVSLPKATTYAVDETRAELVQLIVTKRQTLDVAAQAGGGLFGGIAGALAGVDGIQVDLHFELCRNLLKPEEKSHCP